MVDIAACFRLSADLLDPVVRVVHDAGGHPLHHLLQQAHAQPQLSGQQQSSEVSKFFEGNQM